MGFNLLEALFLGSWGWREGTAVPRGLGYQRGRSGLGGHSEEGKAGGRAETMATSG